MEEETKTPEAETVGDEPKSPEKMQTDDLPENFETEELLNIKSQET